MAESGLRISEIVLRTSRYEEVRRWYQAVLGIEPYLDNERVSFRRLHSEFPYTQVLAIFNRAEAGQGDPTGPGLDHMQFREPSFGALMDHYERLRALGIKPFRSMNHGPGTSFYYRDPDGNVVEFSGANFASEAEYFAFLDSDAFRRNISGVAIDPDDFVAKYRSGMPQKDLVKIG